MSVRALWIQVGLLFAVLYLALLWARPLITPDEARAYFNLANRSSHLVSWAPDINVRLRRARAPRCTRRRLL